MQTQYKINFVTFCNIYLDWGLGIGDWGLGTGDWGLGKRSREQGRRTND
ncbi:hypothetical protein [Nostoc sp. CMAA1605]|nr:hypothetical protein [Nostoc sp. CMAA1605]